MRVNKFAALAMAAITMSWGASAVQAAQIPWLHPSGSGGPGSNFTYDSGGTSDQLFVPAGTDPVVNASGLTLFPSAFKAQASNGTTSSTNQVSDKLSFVLHATGGTSLQSFVVNEFGDYTIQEPSVGSFPNTGVKVFGSLFLTNLDTNQVIYAPLTTTPTTIGLGSGVTSGQGTWSGVESPTIPKGWKNVQVELDNILQANSDPGTNAFIEKKLITPGVSISIIDPEPASAVIGLMSSALLLGRRRRAIGRAIA
jgi:hypothetical protein